MIAFSLVSIAAAVLSAAPEQSAWPGFRGSVANSVRAADLPLTCAELLVRRRRPKVILVRPLPPAAPPPKPTTCRRCPSTQTTDSPTPTVPPRETQRPWYGWPGTAATGNALGEKGRPAAVLILGPHDDLVFRDNQIGRSTPDAHDQPGIVASDQASGLVADENQFTNVSPAIDRNGQTAANK